MEGKKNTNIITINGNDYTVKPGMKAKLVFESLTDKPFGIANTTDVVTYMYASIIAGTPGTRLGFDEFVDALDDPEVMSKLSEMVLQRTAAEKLVAMQNEGGTEPKKD